jgi:formylglycine-generating enzyme required for sulfatase activity
MTSSEDGPGNQTNLQCPACGEPVKSAWKVCPACETPLGRLVCPGCGMEVKENWKICPECGRRVTCATCRRRIPPGQTECPTCRNSKAGKLEDTSLYIEPVTGMEFVFVPAGTFQMGDLYGDGWDNELPLQEVRVESFYLSKHPVTQGQWEKLMPGNPSMFKKGATYPVEQVSWADVQAFIRRLNELSAGGGEFRLPTEAEWEYAARSGGRKELYAGSDDIAGVAWYAENSRSSTQPVGLKAANGLGLHDMSGNVWEWCQNVYIPGAMAGSGRDRPAAKKDMPERVIRGGCFSLDDWSARCSRRFGFPEDYLGAGLGFRLSMTPPIKAVRKPNQSV